MPSTFSDLGVPGDVVSCLAERGITRPFPIQEAALPPALAGRDVCGRAPTGSGKTLAFGIPLVLAEGRARPGRPRALVLVPTRELAAQIERDLTPIAAVCRRTVVAVYGGVGFERQVAALRRGVDIVVACPGRLLDLVERRQAHLDEVDFVVVDEADRMADLGFLPAVRRLLDLVRPDRQTLLFSATLDGDVDVLVRRYQRDPVRAEVAQEPSADTRQHLFWRAPTSQRVAVATGVVSRRESTLVFCRTKRGVDRLARQLRDAGLSVAAIHGDRSQGQREHALAAFSTQNVQALIATDVAARGIHVDDVGCVLHYDLPGDEKAYVHRSGRTGRAGAGGTVISLVRDEDTDAARSLQRLLGFPSKVHEPDWALLADEVPGGEPAPERARRSTLRAVAARAIPPRHSRRRRRAAAGDRQTPSISRRTMR